MPGADIRIGTRGSALARCQATRVQQQLAAQAPDRQFPLKIIAAAADQRPETPLADMGGQGVFVKELETALLRREIDVAVHSLKDLPLATPAGLRLAAILQRDDPSDALVSRSHQGLAQLPLSTHVGTSSLRRRSQLLRRRRDLRVSEIRGNVDTRLRKLDEGQYDAILVASCGLIRLGLAERITERLPMDVMLPEPGQGALAIEVRADDAAAIEVVRALDHRETRACVEAERALLEGLGGGCYVPIAAFAELRGRELQLEAAVTAVDGSREVRGRMQGRAEDPSGLGLRLAEQLIHEGAKTILRL